MTCKEDAFSARVAANMKMFIMAGKMWIVVRVQAEEREPPVPEFSTGSILCTGVECFSARRRLVVAEEGIGGLDDAVPLCKDLETVIDIVIGDGKTVLVETADVPKDVCSCEHACSSNGRKITECPARVPVSCITIG